ncbi:MAG: hypothetical protein JO025_29120 [Verrucomicrobia bacterium]|nr:hypothetical protein [Verrucomicrobiota bacterium]
MKFIVATYGMEGDARPFAALCRGLIDGWSGIDPKVEAGGCILRFVLPGTLQIKSRTL